ncbi:MAG: cytidine deaminase [Anaerolineales bacterium]|jgi:cytidine deaminase
MLTNEIRQELIRVAIKNLERAYAPYSNYPVSAALLTSSGKIFSGVNIENAAYPTSICAERVAVFKAVSEGERSFQAIAVVTPNAGMPCGSCRQVLSEFGLDTIVIIADKDGKIVLEQTIGELLPGAFRPGDLSF